MSTEIKEKIAKLINDHPVVLFMKGSPEQPQCGFSALAKNLIELCGVEDYLTFNVLEDMEIRNGIKEFSLWPTIPQLYIQGEFIGGSDIMQSMFEDGSLQKQLDPFKT